MRFLDSSNSMPVGEIFTGQRLPRIMLSANFRLSFLTEYFSIILSLPADAYKYRSPALNFNPYHDLGIITW